MKLLLLAASLGLAGCGKRAIVLAAGECWTSSDGQLTVCNEAPAAPVRGYWQDHKLPPVLDSSIPSAEVP